MSQDRGGMMHSQGTRRQLIAQNRKIFIGGLNYNTTEDTLKAHFSQYGELADVVVMKFPDTKRSRGFGFITLSSEEEVDACQKARPHIIDGKMVETKRATPREEFSKPEAGQTIKKVFVGGLKEEVDDEEMRSYFSQFGQVVEVTRLIEKDTGKKRGFGFVEFNDYDPVDKCLLTGNHQIGGRRVDVRKAISKYEMDSMRGGGAAAAAAAARGGSRGVWRGNISRNQPHHQGHGPAWVVAGEYQWSGGQGGGGGGGWGDYSSHYNGWQGDEGGASWNGAGHAGGGGWGGAQGYSGPVAPPAGGPMRSASLGGGALPSRGYRAPPYNRGFRGGGGRGGGFGRQ